MHTRQRKAFRILNDARSLFIVFLLYLLKTITCTNCNLEVDYYKNSFSFFENERQIILTIIEI